MRFDSCGDQFRPGEAVTAACTPVVGGVAGNGPLVRHYNQHRPHQLRHPLPPDSTEPAAPAAVTDLQPHRIRRQLILDGLINEYHHDAA